MGNKKLYILFSVIAYLFCIGAPAIMTLIYFPMWVERSAGSTIAGGTLVLLFLCVAPIFKRIKQLIKKTPSNYIWLLWAVIFGVLFLLQPIVEELIIISAAGAVGGLIAIIFFALARKHKPIEEVIRE